MGDLFEIKSNPQLNKDSFVFSKNGEYPYFTRTVFNNGVLGYVNYLNETHKIKGNCLTVGMMGMQFFYMQKDFYAGQFTKRAVAKSFILTQRLATYFVVLLNKNQSVFKNVLVRNFENEFNEFNIQLPTFLQGAFHESRHLKLTQLMHSTEIQKSHHLRLHSDQYHKAVCFLS